jgi:hypothetical protein
MERDVPKEPSTSDHGHAPGAFGQPDGSFSADGGINQGTGDGPLTPEQAAELQRRRALGNAVDNNAASHQGGMGAQGGQADFGSAGNLAGGFGGTK